MKTALLMIRDRPHYRFHAFAGGLARCGFAVSTDHNKLADVAVLWNRSGLGEIVARRFEKAGRPIVVVENGYIGIDAVGHHLFAMALGHHNGAGNWPYRDGDAPADRFEALGVELAPWKKPAGGDVLILPQRGIGPPGVAMPGRWASAVQPRAKAGTWRHVRVRPHPGKLRRENPLEREFPTTEVAVVWGSGAGVKALAAGVPVFYEMPNWIGGPAALFGVGEIERPLRCDASRRMMFNRLAYAQWSAAEIETGEAIMRVLACT